MWYRTPKRPRTVVIEEFYSQSDTGGVVWRYWRFEGQSNWHTIKTPYKQMPYELFDPKKLVDPKELEEMTDELPRG